eukprot:5526982-Pyramimonas_sp.AAC.1
MFVAQESEQHMRVAYTVHSIRGLVSRVHSPRRRLCISHRSTLHSEVSSTCALKQQCTPDKAVDSIHS